MQMNVLSSRDNYALGVYGNVLSVVSRGVTDLPYVAAIVAAGQKMKQTQPKTQFGLFTLVEEQAGMPDGATREAMAKMLVALAPQFVCSALVMEGGGMRTSIIRSIASGVTLLAKQPYPHKIFAELTQGTSWIMSHLKADGFDGQGLSQAVDGLRATR